MISEALGLFPFCDSWVGIVEGERLEMTGDGELLGIGAPAFEFEVGGAVDEGVGMDCDKEALLEIDGFAVGLGAGDVGG